MYFFAHSSPWPTSWVHPRSKREYTISLTSAENLSQKDMDACFNLIESTSGQDYRQSSAGWHPEAKRKEMSSVDLRYILVKDAEHVKGFTSLMPTFENGEPVVYCYEIHLSDELQGYVLPHNPLHRTSLANMFLPRKTQNWAGQTTYELRHYRGRTCPDTRKSHAYMFSVQ